MADLRPADPRQKLKDTATATGSFTSVYDDRYVGELAELRASDLPAFAIDPREEELDHESTSTSKRVYHPTVRYVIYLAVESGPDPSDRSSARQTLNSLRDDVLTQLADTASGQAEKTARNRDEIQQGESTVMVDAMTIDYTQKQIFT